YVAGEYLRAHQARREARALLIGPVDEADRRLRLDASVVQCPEYLEAGKNAEDAIEFAAGRLGVEVRADCDGQSRRFASVPLDVDVSDVVDADVIAGLAGARDQPVAHQTILLRQCKTADAAIGRTAEFGGFHQRRPEPIAVHADIQK